MPAHASMLASRAGRIGRLVAGGLLSLLAVDCALRLVEATPLWRVLPLVEPILGHPDKNVGFDLTPRATGVWPREHRAPVRINSLGLRDVERQPAKPAGSLRIGLLGDSMVEATQVAQEATFGALAERKLVADGRKIELVNLALAGPNPMRQLLRLESRGYRMGLDWVVANSASGSFVSGLLLDDSQNPAYAETGEGRLVRSYGFRQRLSQRYADQPIGQAFVALYQNSPLFRMLYLHVKKPWSEMFGLLSPAQPSLRRPATAPACSTTILEPHVEFWRDHRPTRAWAAAGHFLDEFAASTKEHGVRVIYAVRDIPMGPMGCAAVDRLRAELISTIAGEFSRRGMRFVDWSGAVAESFGQRDTEILHGFGVRRGSGHLNHEGHRVWASTLVGVLEIELPPASGFTK